MLSDSINESSIQLTNNGKLRHLVSLKNLEKNILVKLLDEAQEYTQSKKLSNELIAHNKQHIIANLFFEPSTRTRASFEIAAQRLGLNIINFDIENSSGKKGESILDTVMTLKSMGVDVLVIRHKEIGIHSQLIQEIGTECIIVNAGEGHISHPTQGLLDLLTIQQVKKTFENLIVTIVGDIAHSRVARSTAEGLTTMGVKELRLVAPNEFMPHEKLTPISNHFVSLDEGLKDADVVMALRIQHERMDDININLDGYIKKYRITRENVKVASPNAIIMHPGPMNRDVEIESSLADGDQSVILRQVANGVAVRMALLNELTKNHSE
ncbi:MAG: aspartate carbamoyltransferase catalytic subunit [Woeseiaceae bacterium]|jgi:aspartate carbamoyltransferase catalytic subunit|tara:strand:- start:5536 stop:6510 length:975 start_codon:yes stop_codon:yes gene_type:complete